MRHVGILFCTTLSIGFKNTFEWGNAEMVAKNFQFEFKRRGGDGDLWVSGKRPVGATSWGWRWKTGRHHGEMIIEYNYYLPYIWKYLQ